VQEEMFSQDELLKLFEMNTKTDLLRTNMPKSNFKQF